jgi:hypothetical protein
MRGARLLWRKVRPRSVFRNLLIAYYLVSPMWPAVLDYQATF